MSRRPAIFSVFLVASLVIAAAAAGEWPRWRGPQQNGVSNDTGVVSSWTINGENQLWHADFIGRSTPVAFDGRVCAVGRTSREIRQEVASCWDAATGKLLWERRFNVYHTAVPYSRVGWATVEGDPETGYLYVHGVGGPFFCFDRDGKVVWQLMLTEDFGRVSGYGGRTHSPMVDEDRVILSYSNFGWGDQAVPRQRTFAFNKLTGDLVWVSTPGGRPDPITTQSTPVVAEIDGQRLLIEANGDGSIHALKARTGEKVWSFALSKQGPNTSVVVDGYRVYATSADENLDEPTMGRVVCIDGRGKGDITKTHELWRANELGVGFSSPLLHKGTLYVIDDSANMFALDATTGAQKWTFNVGTVGKASPVWADGKIIAAEVNGHVHIIKPGDTSATALDADQITMPEGRHAEIYGSPIVAWSRIFLSTEAGVFAIGSKDAPAIPPTSLAPRAGVPAAAAGAQPAWLQVVPAEVIAKPGVKVALTARAFDASGRLIGVAKDAVWSVQGLTGAVDASGFTPDAGKGGQAGQVVATLGDLKGSSRVRVFTDLPWLEDFSSMEEKKNPAMWIGGAGRFVVASLDGNKVLTKPFMDQGLERSSLFIGLSTMSGYIIQSDVRGSIKGRKRSDLGLVNSGYTLDMMGAHQRLELRDWEERRLHQTAPFAWEPDVWYSMKLMVDASGDKATIRGKAWKASDPEPSAWTIEAQDPLPIRQGSPGLYGYSAADIFYDNIKVTVNQR